MAVEEAEQLHECERWLGLAVLVTGKRIDAATEEFCRLTLVKLKFPADFRM